MNFGNSTIMQFMGAQMRYQSQRQVAISQNIANIDTPGYQAREIQPVDFEDLLKRHSTRLEMRATSPSHKASTNNFNGSYKVQKDRTTYESSPAGNSVSLEEQMKRLAENSSAHQLTTNLIKKYNNMYRAAGSGSQ